ncbi:type VII secretion protein EssC [Paenibacillus shirakamiensis]|nr:type VII secretion protein EssC [Paenibacillus shirakamiensis]
MYQRSPRIIPSLEPIQIEMMKPPAEPNKPQVSSINFILPALMTMMAVSFFIYMSISGKVAQGHYVIYEILTTLLVLISYIYPLVHYIGTKREFVNSTQERILKYQELLEKYRKEFQQNAENQRSVMTSIHCSPHEWMEVASVPYPSLWERSPKDSDFLELRVGTGSVPFHVEVKSAQQEGYSEDLLLSEGELLRSEFRSVPLCPVTLPVHEARIVGVVGSAELTANMMRVILTQLTASHAPNEVKLAAFYEPQTADAWQWIRWFPHTWNEEKDQRYVAGTRAEGRALAETLYDQLHPRANQRDGSEPLQRTLSLVTVLTYTQGIEDESLYSLLMDQSYESNSFTFIMADSTENLPRQCRLIVDCKEDQTSYYYKKEDGSSLQCEFEPDAISREQIEILARNLAPIQLKRTAFGELPLSLPLMDLLGMRGLDDWDVKTTWDRNRFPLTLPIPVGIRSGGKTMILNLHDKMERQGHGPHGLIAGTTGSGKSELLQSLIITLALEYHPHDLTFLLIDYKGGGMSNTFGLLPHVMGSITNLDQQVMDRAKISLRAELVRRQRILKEAGNLQHIDEYYQLANPEPLPHLVVIIDEFAELKRDHPQFMDELVSIASIGRTLGLHLILATQKPAGVVDDKIWSNARFRICLRVESEADSRDMIKLPDAAWINKSGRGYFQVGSSEVFEEVQFAWSGAPYVERDQNPGTIQISRVLLSGERIPYLDREEEADMATSVVKQLQILIECVNEHAKSLQVERLQGPWLEPLPDMIDPIVDTLHEPYVEDPTELHAWVGLLDNVAEQNQEKLAVSLNEGHLILYGMPGSGKSTFVHTVLMSLAQRYSPDQWHGYIIDMGRTMKDFKDLPQIGDIIDPNDEDRMKRLFRFVMRVLTERRQSMALHGVKTLTEYRQMTDSTLPELLIVLDGYYMFRSSFPAENESLEILLREGASIGIHFLITTHRLGDMPEKMRSSIPRSIVFQLADPSEYHFVMGRLPSTAEPQLPPGRGFVKHHAKVLEFQTALPASGPDELKRYAILRDQIQHLDALWNGRRPDEIRPLPEKVFLHELLSMNRNQDELGSAQLGIQTEDLEPFEVSLQSGPHFIVGSPLEGGKSTLLTSWILSLAWSMSPEELQIFTVDGRQGSDALSKLSDLPHIRGYSSGERNLLELLENLVRPMSLLTNAEGKLRQPVKLLVIDDADVFARQLQDFALKDKLNQTIRKAREYRIHVIVSGIPTDFPTFGVEWFTEIRNGHSGFLLGSRDANDLSYFRIPMSEGSMTSGEVPVLSAGQGYYIKRKYIKIKVAVPYDGDHQQNSWVQKIKSRWKILVGGEVG